MGKGQITVYVIVGLITVIALGFILIRVNKSKQEEITADNTYEILEKQAEQIEYYIEQCLFDITTEAIFNKIGLQGGYIDPEYNEYYGDYDQVEWRRSGYIKIPYWYYNGRDISPTLEQVETKLGRYILVEAEACTNFEDFISLEGAEIIKPETSYQETYFDFSKESSHIDVSINDEDVSVKYFFPISIKYDNKQKSVEEFHTEIPIAFGNNFKLAKYVLDEAIDAQPDGLNLVTFCAESNRLHGINIHQINRKIKIYDYNTYLDKHPLFGTTFILQFAYNDLTIFGYCAP